MRLGLTSAATWVVVRYIIYRLYLHQANSIPGPRVDWIPLLGNMREILREPPAVPHRKWTEQYGNVVCYHGPWNRPTVLVTDPEIMKQILTLEQYDFAKPAHTRRFLAPVVGEDGVLLVEGDIHRQQRKLLNPAFSLQALRSLVPAIIKPALQLRDKWLAQLHDNHPTTIAVDEGLSLATLDVIGMAGFGAEFQSVLDAPIDTSGGRLSQAYLDLSSGDNNLARAIGIFIPAYNHIPTQRNRSLKHDIHTLHSEALELIKQGHKELQQQPESNRALLSLMLRAVDDDTGRTMSDQELKAQCLTFLAAGHETTAVALSWGLWLLAQHKDIQDALREEIMPVFSDVDQDMPSYEQVNNLPLLNNVCKEVMRLYPPVPMVTRVTVKDQTVLGGRHVLPKNTSIVMMPLITHRDPKYWGNDAHLFRPSRWNESPANQANPYVYMPFLEGGRKCIGYRFALIEFKIMLAIMLTRLQFSEEPGFKPRMRQQVTLRPKPNMKLVVEPFKQ
ncbi:cytochrome P450 [Lichtheimia hyalospora FSU 10163]|nr:cytochrome P450 [Lichtheimia hyalospora FSU 10163]